ncbi:hypothetical protein HMPREF3066_02115 [Neisseria sp. HMSC03D10]|jgi:GIY-YIG catalytic domain protein|nr:hypothetical protein HMPREF3066_02115 [Neisseria sp. HMSC03D10]
MKKYKVYRIIHSSNGKKYIGLTKRGLVERLRAHFNELTRKAKSGRFVNPFSLQAAMYEEYEKNKSNWRKVKFNLFRIELVQDFDSEQEMIDYEFNLIINENTLVPNGYNLMNGGHSIGGTGRNQAISINNFVDGNGVCRSWNFDSKKEMYLELSKEYSIKEYTLRWRVNNFIEKNRNNYCNDFLAEEVISDAIYYAIYEFSDSRKTGGTNILRQRKRRCNQKMKLHAKSSFSNEIKYPNENGDFILNSSEFSELNNIPKSTVRARSMRFLENNGFQYENNVDLNRYIQKRKKEFLDFILTNHSNSKNIKFTQGDNEYSGSLTSLAKHFGLNISTVKKRYKSLDVNLRLKNECLLWVFGLCENPRSMEKKHICDTFSQNNTIHEYILSENVRFFRQIDFVRAVEQVLDKLGVDYSSVQKKVSYYIPKNNEMSDMEKTNHIIIKLEKKFNLDNLKKNIIDNFNTGAD